MFDIVIPIHVRNRATDLENIFGRDSGHEFTPGLVKTIDFPHRLILIGDRCDPSELQEVSHLENVVCLVNEQLVGFNHSLREAMEQARSSIVVVIRPDIDLSGDPLWFGKLQKVFRHDARAGVVVTEPFSKSSSLLPNKVSHSFTPIESGLMMLSREFAMACPPFGAVDPFKHYVSQARKWGLNAWVHPGVVYDRREHIDHILWPGPSTQSTILQGSPSQTTPSSSSQTTTEKDGSKDSQEQDAPSESSTFPDFGQL